MDETKEICMSAGLKLIPSRGMRFENTRTGFILYIVSVSIAGCVPGRDWSQPVSMSSTSVCTCNIDLEIDVPASS